MNLPPFDAGSAVESLRALGAFGALFFGVFFLVATPMLFPAAVLTAIAGFLYGPFWGAALISPIGALSAGLMFVISRHAVRSSVHEWMVKYPRLVAVDLAVSRKGFRTVLLLRLASVVPFAPLSYLLGASRLRGQDFMLASWLGLLPGTFIYAFIGSLASDFSEVLGEGNLGGSDMKWISVLSLVAALMTLWTVGRIAGKAIRKGECNEKTMASQDKV